MPLYPSLETAFHRLTHQLFAIWPQPVPVRSKLEQIRIISHRGERDNLSVFENTLAAFDTAMQAGVWGIELDIQWSRDHEPVVFHDADCMRLFNSDSKICHLSFSEIKQKFPLIPSLEEIITRYGHFLHLMIELKEETFPVAPQHLRRLKNLLARLAPRHDYHLLSLNPNLFNHIDFLPPRAFIAIARLNFRKLSAAAITHGYGGISGHYLFFTDTILQRHHRMGQKVGTGFVESENCLYREINRGVDWIISNQAAKLQRICTPEKSAGSRSP